jgi:hypothetical protein
MEPRSSTHPNIGATHSPISSSDQPASRESADSKPKPRPEVLCPRRLRAHYQLLASEEFCREVGISEMVLRRNFRAIS